MDKVRELHPAALGKPFVFGNCQAGWHAIIAACMRPDVVGPVVIAGAPLSYWAGVRGKNPMRYLGGLLGGSWLDRLMSDLGNGTFDAAWLVANFDNLNPANTLWSKQYNVWSDSEQQTEPLSASSRSGGVISCYCAARKCSGWSIICLSGTSFRPPRS